MKKQVVAIMLATTLIFGQAMIASAETGSQQIENVQSENVVQKNQELSVAQQNVQNNENDQAASDGIEMTSDAEQLEANAKSNESESVVELEPETRTLYLEDYPETIWEFEGIADEPENMQIKVEDTSIVQCTLKDADYNYMGHMRVKALKTGKTTVNISWNQSGKTFQKTVQVVVQAQMPLDGIRIHDDTLREELLEEHSWKAEDGQMFGNDGYISKDEMESLISFIASDVQNLDGLEYATNLKYLTVSGTVTNLESLGKLKKLKELDIHCEKLTDLSVLNDLPELTVLELDYCSELKDITNVYNLAKQLNNVRFFGTSVPTDQKVEFLKQKLQNGFAVGQDYDLVYYDLDKVSVQNDSDIVRVDGNSKLIALKAGSTTIKADINGSVYEIPVTVKAASEESLQLGETVGYTAVDVKDET